MITGWRLSKKKYASPPSAAFDGEGARLYGGRWNQAGRKVAYASSSLALDCLEYFVNLDSSDAPINLVAVQVDVPSTLVVERVSIDRLPHDWQSHPYPDALRVLGSAWLDSKSSVCLLVPSVVIPQEANLLVNPVHSDFSKLVFHPPSEFVFDARMWK